MRKTMSRLAVVAVAAAAIMPVAAPSAHAWTCTTQPLPVDPDPGVIACDLFLKATGPICAKYGCD